MWESNKTWRTEQYVEWYVKFVECWCLQSTDPVCVRPSNSTRHKWYFWGTHIRLAHTWSTYCFHEFFFLVFPRVKIYQKRYTTHTRAQRKKNKIFGFNIVSQKRISVENEMENAITTIKSWSQQQKQQNEAKECVSCFMYANVNSCMPF